VQGHISIPLASKAAKNKAPCDVPYKGNSQGALDSKKKLN